MFFIKTCNFFPLVFVIASTAFAVSIDNRTAISLLADLQELIRLRINHKSDSPHVVRLVHVITNRLESTTLEGCLQCFKEKVETLENCIQSVHWNDRLALLQNAKCF